MRCTPNSLPSFGVLVREFDDAVDEFCRDYPSFVEERRGKLRGMFDPADYPDPKDIRSKFNLDRAILPFPDVADFRSDLDPDVVADIREEIAAEVKRASGGVNKESAKEIAKVVGHMAEKLKEYKNEPGKKNLLLGFASRERA